MNWLLAVSVITAAVVGCLCDEDPDVKEVIERKEPARPVAVLYVVEKLRVADGPGPEKKDGGVVLANPIADDGNVPDGVYFRPVDGKEVEKGTVSTLKISKSYPPKYSISKLFYFSNFAFAFQITVYTQLGVVYRQSSEKNYTYFIKKLAFAPRRTFVQYF